MGFFRSLGKMLTGKPVYSPQDQNTPQQGQPGIDHPVTQPGQPAAKVIPVVRMGRIENQVDGPRLAIYTDIRNDSAVPIFLDHVILCGTLQQLDTQLRAGEVRQLLVYSGPLLQNQPSGYVEVHYRTAETADYFVDYHEIHSHQEEDRGFIITELLLRGPVKDLR